MDYKINQLVIENREFNNSREQIIILDLYGTIKRNKLRSRDLSFRSFTGSVLLTV